MLLTHWLSGLRGTWRFDSHCQSARPCGRGSHAWLLAGPHHPQRFAYPPQLQPRGPSSLDRQTLSFFRQRLA